MNGDFDRRLVLNRLRSTLALFFSVCSLTKNSNVGIMVESDEER